MEQPTEFLTKDELTDLTGYRQKKRQIEWLKQHNYIIQDENRYKPLVLYKDVYGKARYQSTTQPKTKWQPPPYLIGAENGKTSQTTKSIST
ncbi:DUF4224 domain-containing protein [Mannheimia haemolytica]|uniref:DUF4224 domain-containing protein n=1 Tax=Mannheimia haemolytica TaxID=75985 RepID=UPI0003856840|nr:DUF4224 domain-containing protein [Mannheimia haemolytica]EPZ00344.1 hypothetical protein L278_06615 [Mannheimia haemolytica D35]MDW1150534.1 DUF4224 domain-containing protein [Mannheimia haemolytica]MDW1160692.1 DUF4224 domain-containing protein [Mannheimia haemolytica]NBB68058.1 DUF4224 domain-containing protein [Mannheimia haemolytica]TRC49999.1 DUF4224 domain-containing protein [Mannheimia haemolytica]